MMSPFEQITLLKNIAAFQIQPAQNGREQLGVISQLPRGAELRFCGDGFNARTMKVAWGGQHYFVFRQDVEQHESQFD
jgi:hypothetical protein